MPLTPLLALLLIASVVGKETAKFLARQIEAMILAVPLLAHHLPVEASRFRIRRAAGRGGASALGELRLGVFLPFRSCLGLLSIFNLRLDAAAQIAATDHDQ